MNKNDGKINQETLVGKTILVGLAFLDRQRRPVERYETHGRIESISGGLVKIVREESEPFLLPFDEHHIQEAPPGVYKERTTGAAITNPDYIAQLNVIVKDTEGIEYCKKYGYRPRGLNYSH